EDRICFVKGNIERSREEPGLVLTRVLAIDQARRELTKGLVLSLSVGIHPPEIMDAVANILRRSPGNCQVFLNLRDAAGRRATLKLSDDFRINPATVSVADLETILGKQRVAFSAIANGR